MKIQSSPPPVAARTTPRLPDLEQVTVQDRFLQTSVGAVACAVPSGVGALGALVGHAVAGPVGGLVGGALATAGVAAGTYYGLGKLPSEAPEHQKTMQARLALRSGLLAAAGAVGGGYAVAGSAALGGLFSGRVIDQAESMFGYGPTPPSGAPPEGFEKRTIRTSDGVQLETWYSPEPKEAPLALLFHSNATSLEDNEGRIDTMRSAGLRVMAVEYRGFGNQGGIPHEHGLRRDALAAYEAARKEADADQLFLAGQSLGGGVAAGLAAEKPCAGLILESTFTSLSAMAEPEAGPWAASLLRGRFPTADRVRDLQVPVLVAHGDADWMVPVEMGRTLSQRSPQATYVEVPGAGHMDVYQDDRFAQALTEFVKPKDR